MLRIGITAYLRVRAVVEVISKFACRYPTGKPLLVTSAVLPLL